MSEKTTLSVATELPNDSSPMEDPLRLLPRGLTKLNSIWVSLTYPFASKGKRLSIHYSCDLSRLKAHRIKLGDSVRIMNDVSVSVVAPPRQYGDPIVMIDDNVGIGPYCQISAKNCIHVERDTIIAQSALISDHIHAAGSSTPPSGEAGASEGGRIIIGQGSWIGRGAAVVCTRGELVLGRHCVVAANALVTTSFPPYSVIIGNPGRVIRRFDPEKNSWVIGSGRSSLTANKAI